MLNDILQFPVMAFSYRKSVEIKTKAVQVLGNRCLHNAWTIHAVINNLFTTGQRCIIFQACLISQI